MLKYKKTITLIASFFFVLIGSMHAQPLQKRVYSLNAVIDSAIANNFKLKASMLNDSLTLKEIEIIARNYKPRITALASYSYWDWLMPNKAKLLGENVKTDMYIELSAYQLIYDWGRTRQNKLLQESDININREFIRLLRQNISTSVTLVYLEALKSLKKIEVLNNTLSQLKSHLEIARNLYNIGKVSQIDLLKIQVEIRVTEKELTTAENNYLEQLTNLVNLAQIKGDTDFSLEENTANLYEKTKLFFTDTMLVSMSQNHPVLKSYDEKLAREKILESLYKKQSNPEVFSYMTTNWESAYIPFSKNFNYNIGAGIRYTLPYWSGGSYHDRIAQSRIRSDQLQNSRMDEYLNLKREFDALVVQQKNKIQEIESNREIILIANKSLDNILIMYESGQESILNLLDAQTILTKQKILYEQSIIEYLELIARINYVCGIDNLPY